MTFNKNKKEKYFDPIFYNDGEPIDKNDMDQKPQHTIPEQEEQSKNNDQ